MPDPTQATCSVNIYAACDITEEKNCVVEHIDDYLGTLQNSKAYATVQTFNTKLVKETSVVLSMNDYKSATTGWNYMRVYINPNYFYYFITGHQRCGNNQVRFFIKMDTVNTCWNYMRFEDTTHIMREHKDRFRKKAWNPETPGYLDRIIDRMPEDVAPELFKGTDTEITEAQNLDWYLVYKTEKEQDVNDISNPLHCYLCANNSFTLDRNGATFGEFFPNDFIQNKIYILTYQSGINDGSFNLTLPDDSHVGFTLDSSTYKYVLLHRFTSGGNEYIGVKVFKSTWAVYNTWTCKSFTFTGSLTEVYKADEEYVNLNDYGDEVVWNLIIDINDKWDSGLAENPTIQSIDTIDKTDSKIMKIIALPYRPSDDITYSSITERWSIDDTVWKYNPGMGMLELIDLNTELEHQINKSTNSDMRLYVSVEKMIGTYNKWIDAESKLFNSSYYQRKYFYDTFNKIIPFEDYNHVALTNPYITIKFKMSNQIQSRFLFHFDVDYYNYKSLGDYPKEMIVSRNNEITLYNNDYLNYMRTGYNYDVKSKERTTAFGVASLGLGIAGTIAGATLGATGVGLATGVGILSSALSFVNTAMSQDAQLKQKINSLQQQSGSVSVNDDFNLLKYYSNNRLRMTTYTLSDITKNALHNFFHLCGYNTNYYGKPTFNSRYWWNFIQMTPVFKMLENNLVDQAEIKFTEEMRKDIIQRCEAGITIFHKRYISATTYTWDFEQKYENWEEWVINGNT